MMNISKDTNVNYAEIASKSGEEILQMVKEKKLVPPTKGEHKDNFMKFVQAAAGSQERTDLLTKLGIKPASSDSELPPDEAGGGNGKPPDESIADGEEVDGAGGTPPANTVDDLLKEMGLKDQSELVSTFNELRTTSAKLQNALNKANASNGAKGREVQTLREQLENVNNRLKETEGKLVPKEMEQPAMPTMPNPKDFDEGALDDGYREAMAKWSNDMTQYQKDMLEFSNSVKPSWAKELEKNLSDVTATLGEVKEKSDTTQQSQAEQQFTSAWDNFWDNEIPELQKQFGLVTSIPFRTINDNKLIMEQPDAYTPEQVESAKAWFKTLSAADRQAFSKTAKLLRTTHTFPEGGTPQRNYKRDPRSAIIEAGMENEFPLKREVSPSNPPGANSDSVAATPGSELGANDASLAAPQNKQEKLKRLQDILATAKKNPRNFKGNQEMQKEYRTLVAELGMKLPK